MRTTTKELKAEIALLKNQIKREREDNVKLFEDRRKYRTWVIDKLKWFIELNGKGTNPNAAYLIEEIGKLLNKCESFHW